MPAVLPAALVRRRRFRRLQAEASADPQGADAALVARAGAPLFKDMGEYHRPITTRDAGAQRYFDQGMVLAFGFNHAEAIRSFRAAQKLDPQCAMCFWGEGLGARAERTALLPLRDSVKVTFLDTNDLPATTLLTIADELLRGEIALADNSLEAAIRHFQAAVEIQDSLPYMEPPFWYYPTRRSLGAALLQAKRFADAEAVYRKDLEGYPHNGWSMSGLAESLEAQGKTAEAAEMRKMFEHVWARADVTLKGSRV